MVADLPARERSRSLRAGQITVAEEDGEGKDHQRADSKEARQKKPPPTQFNEPDANSLLDAFGF